MHRYNCFCKIFTNYNSSLFPFEFVGFSSPNYKQVIHNNSSNTTFNFFFLFEIPPEVCLLSGSAKVIKYLEHLLTYYLNVLNKTNNNLNISII